jgi:hypothetical protein
MSPARTKVTEAVLRHRFNAEVEHSLFRMAVKERLRVLGADLDVAEVTVTRTKWSVTLRNPATGQQAKVSGASQADMPDYMRDAAADLLEGSV